MHLNVQRNTFITQHYMANERIAKSIFDSQSYDKIVFQLNHFGTLGLKIGRG